MAPSVSGPAEPQPFKLFEPPRLNTYADQGPYKGSGWYKARKYTLDELWQAVGQSNTDLLEKCLKAGLSVDYCRWVQGRLMLSNPASSSPASAHSLIDVAVRVGKLETVRLLIKHGADLTGSAAAAHAAKYEVTSHLSPNEIEKKRLTHDMWSTPLHRAAVVGATELMLLLLDEGGADVNVMNPRSRTPLHSAVHDQSAQSVKLLLDRGASVDVADSHGSTPLALSALFGHLDSAKLLASHDASLDSRDNFGETPLYNAAFRGHTKVVRFLSASGADPDLPNAAGMSAFFEAASNFNTAMMDTLVNCGANVDSRDLNGCTPLIRAAMAKNHALVKHLLRYGCDIHATDEDDWTALEASMISGDEDTILLLLLYGAADVVGSSSSPTPLHHAATHDCTPVARFLLRPNQPYLSAIDARDEEGDTALILAASHNHVGILRHLLRSGASFSCADSTGNTALEHAAYWGNYPCCLELVRAGASFGHATYDALARGRADHDSVMHNTSPQRRRGDRTLDFDAITRHFVPEDLEMPPYAGRGGGVPSSFARSIDPTPRLRKKQGKPPPVHDSFSSVGTAAATVGASSTVAASTAGPLESVRSSESIQSTAAGGVLLSPERTRTSFRSVSSTGRSPLRDSTTARARQELSPDPFEACIPATQVEQIINNYVVQKRDSDGIGAITNTVTGAVNLVSAILGS